MLLLYRYIAIELSMHGFVFSTPRPVSAREEEALAQKKPWRVGYFGEEEAPPRLKLRLRATFGRLRALRHTGRRLGTSPGEREAQAQMKNKPV